MVRACGIVGFSRAAYYRPPQPAAERDAAVIARIMQYVDRFPRIGFWQMYRRMRRSGSPWNFKRVLRVYRALGLNQPRRTKRRVPKRVRQPLDAPALLNWIWSLDFMSDALYGGRKIRILNVLDEGNREGLASEAATSFPAARVVRLLDELVALYGKPWGLRLDNGPEFTSEKFTEWCRTHGIRILYIQPGKPDQNAYIERFNRSYREGVLDPYVFASVEEVQQITDEWLEDYNSERPHKSLGRVPPRTFLPRPKRPRESSYELST